MTTEDDLKVWNRDSIEGLKGHLGSGGMTPSVLNDRILKLIDLVRKQQRVIEKKDEALLSVTTWFDEMQSDHWEKTSKNFKEACDNWDSLLQKPLEMNPIKDALAITVENIKEE